MRELHVFTLSAQPAFSECFAVYPPLAEHGRYAAFDGLDAAFEMGWLVLHGCPDHVCDAHFSFPDWLPCACLHC